MVMDPAIDVTQEVFQTTEAAKYLNVTTKTLRTWDKEGSFKPDFIGQDGNRRYSQRQIERKTGKTLYQLRNPIMSFTKEKIKDLIFIAGNTTHLDFNQLHGDTLKDKYSSLYCKFIQISTSLYRKNEYSPPNFIFTSPEIASLFEVVTAGFSPVGMDDEIVGKKKILCIGTLNCKWKIYSSFLVEESEMLLGYVENGEVFEKENFLSHVKISNFVI